MGYVDFGGASRPTLALPARAQAETAGEDPEAAAMAVEEAEPFDVASVEAME
jgi:hypothetical protein